MRSKPLFRHPSRSGRDDHSRCCDAGNVAFGSIESGNTPYATMPIMRTTWITFTSIRSRMGLWRGRPTGLSRHFATPLDWVCIRRIGRGTMEAWRNLGSVVELRRRGGFLAGRGGPAGLFGRSALRRVDRRGFFIIFHLRHLCNAVVNVPPPVPSKLPQGGVTFVTAGWWDAKGASCPWLAAVGIRPFGPPPRPSPRGGGGRTWRWTVRCGLDGGGGGGHGAGGSAHHSRDDR